MKNLTLTERRASAILYAVLLVVAIAAFSVTSTFPSPLLPGYPGSAMFPRLVLIAMGLICLLGLISLFRSRKSGLPDREIGIPVGSFAVIMTAISLFAVLLTVLGMEPAVLAFVGGSIWYRTRSLTISAVSGVGSVIVVYFLFVQALSVHLPLLFLPRYLLSF